MLRSVRLSVCLSVRTLSSSQTVHFMAVVSYQRTLTGNPMLQVELNCQRHSQRGRTATGSDRNGRWHVVSPPSSEAVLGQNIFFLGGGFPSLWGSAVSSPRGVWGKSNFAHFSLKIWQLVASNLLIFLRINWSQCVKSTAKFRGPSHDLGVLCPPCPAWNRHWLMDNWLKHFNWTKAIFS